MNELEKLTNELNKLNHRIKIVKQELTMEPKSALYDIKNKTWVKFYKDEYQKCLEFKIGLKKSIKQNKKLIGELKND